MTNVIIKPEIHQIYNELDKTGLLLGEPRLVGERNADYKRRLHDVFVHRANSTHLGLIYGITRDLGLSLYEAITITTRRPSGVPLSPAPTVIFQDTKCYVYSDITLEEDGLVAVWDRFDYGSAYTLTQITELITSTGLFTAAVKSGVNGNLRSMCIYNQSNSKLVTSEDITHSGARAKLKNTNLISNTVVLRSDNLNQRVLAAGAVTKSNQYYIDLAAGILYCGSIPSEGSVIRYKYRIDDYIAIASPVIIHNLQSDDFKSKMFDGGPTELGADIINELLSVYPTNLGK